MASFQCFLRLICTNKKASKIDGSKTSNLTIQLRLAQVYISADYKYPRFPSQTNLTRYFIIIAFLFMIWYNATQAVQVKPKNVETIPEKQQNMKTSLLKGQSLPQGR